MIFPRHCKEVGYARGKPCGDRVYFLSRYLVVETPDGTEVREVIRDPEGKGMMRPIQGTRLLAPADQVHRYPEKVNLHDRTRLVRLARESGKRCTVFTGRDEHLTFVCDPDLSPFLPVHAYDVSPPAPSLLLALDELERGGLFGELSVFFVPHLRDISDTAADVYPCRAAGFPRTLDADPVKGGERIAGCITSAQVVRECYGTEFTRAEICPLELVEAEPFIARCCRGEREGVGVYRGFFGGVVHWGASPRQIAMTVERVVQGWREARGEGCSG
jgi:hypothetical protein